MDDPKISIGVQYQPLRKGASRPEDWGSTHGFYLNGVQDFALLPNVGDYVNLIGINDREGNSNFSGKVRSRLFTQFTTMNDDGTTKEVSIGVNIVVEEDDDDWGKLIKE